MKKYESYKNSGIDWIGDIPKSWIVAKIGFFSDVYRGSGYQILNEVDEDYNGKKEKVLRIGDFNSYNPIWCEYKEQFENYRINKDDLLIGGTGHYFGKSLSVTEEMVGLIHSYNIIRLVINKLCSKYVFYWLSSPLIREQLDISVLGAGQPFIDIKGLKDMQILTPSLKEQTQIANYLDHKTKIIDALIEKKEQLIKKLQAQRQAIINEAVTKGLNPNTKMKDSGVEWLGEIPEHWKVVKFRYKFNTTKGLTITKSNLLDEGIPCVNYGEIHSKYGFEVNPEIHKLKYVSEDYLDSNESSLLSKGDFVFADTSEDIEGAGNFTHLNSDIPTFAGYHTIIARLIDESNYRFVAYFLDSIAYRAQIQNLVKGVKVYSITNKILKDTSLFFPPENEQDAIAQFIDNKVEKISSSRIKLEESIKKLKTYRQSIISEAVTGKIDIRDWQAPSKN
ncbi:restriction endonuclease subunit S [Maribacter sp. R77961]|uniref:restriction endonuclease subunit S n=1 Tax=Maribacter sp. R77961 TaxID=3093871 RepID=UPI0037CA7F33